MKTIFLLSYILATIALAAPAKAGSTYVGDIRSVLPHVAGNVFFFTSAGSKINNPSCATHAQRWVIPLSTTGGQSAASLIIAAYGMHKRVTVSGTGACSVWGDTETVNYISMED